MKTDPKNVIVTENTWSALHDAIQVHHQRFPELRVGGQSLCEAAERLVRCLESSLDVVVDPAHREPVRQAIADVRALVARAPGRPVAPGA